MYVNGLLLKIVVTFRNCWG